MHIAIDKIELIHNALKTYDPHYLLLLLLDTNLLIASGVPEDTAVTSTVNTLYASVYMPKEYVDNVRLRYTRNKKPTILVSTLNIVMITTDLKIDLIIHLTTCPIQFT